MSPVRRRLKSGRQNDRRGELIQIVDVDDATYDRLLREGKINSRGEVLERAAARSRGRADVAGLVRQRARPPAPDVVVIDEDDDAGDVVGGPEDVTAPPSVFFSGEQPNPEVEGPLDDPLGVERFFSPTHAMPAAAADPTIRWGDSLQLTYSDTIESVQSGQFLNTKLRAPSACTVSVHIEQQGDPGVVNWSSVTLFIGVGSSRLQRELAWANLPAPGGAPVDFVLELVAVHELYAIGAARAVTNVMGGTTLLNFTVQIAPLEKN
jgi:hypothetical protein